MGKGSDSARRLGLLAVAAALAAGIALAERRRGGGARRGAREETYVCDCGTPYRVQGVDRHRVYWREGEAVLGDRCAVCDAPLPAGHDAAVV